jgi:hypothetical protein
VYVPDLEITHLSGMSAGKGVSRADFQSLGNLSQIVARMHGVWQGKLFDLVTLMGFFLRFLIYGIFALAGRDGADVKRKRMAKLVVVSYRILTGSHRSCLKE